MGNACCTDADSGANLVEVLEPGIAQAVVEERAAAPPPASRNAEIPERPHAVQVGSMDMMHSPRGVLTPSKEAQGPWEEPTDDVPNPLAVLEEDDQEYEQVYDDQQYDGQYEYDEYDEYGEYDEDDYEYEEEEEEEQEDPNEPRAILTFLLPDGTQRPVIVRRCPLGVGFKEEMPLVVNCIRPGSVAAELDIQPDWILEEVNGESIFDASMANGFKVLEGALQSLPRMTARPPQESAAKRSPRSPKRSPRSPKRSPRSAKRSPRSPRSSEDTPREDTPRPTQGWQGQAARRSPRSL